MLDVEQRSGVAVVRLRHGKVNALDLELLQALTAAMRGVDESAPVVITGTGTAFSAGVDLQRIVAAQPTFRSSCPRSPRPSWLSLITPGRCWPPSTAMPSRGAA